VGRQRRVGRKDRRAISLSIVQIVRMAETTDSKFGISLHPAQSIARAIRRQPSHAEANPSLVSLGRERRH
jgi:hypothetical protein